MFDFMKSLCMFAHGPGFWLITFMVTVFVFSVHLTKLLGEEGTWKRAGETGWKFVVAFVVLGTFPANLWWLLIAVAWLYEIGLVWALLLASFVGAIVAHKKNRQDWQLPSKAVFAVSFLWAFGQVVKYTIFA